MREDKIEVVESDAILRPKDEKTEEKKISLSDLLEKIKSPLIQPLLLPKSVKYHFSWADYYGKKSELFVLEEEPKVRVLNFQSDPYYNSYRGFRGRASLSFPFLVYFIEVRDGDIPSYSSSLFFRPSPLTSLDDRLFLANPSHPLPIGNLFYNPEAGGICLNFSRSRKKPKKGDIEEHIKFFWGSDFYEINWPVEKSDKRIQSVESWQKATKEDPSFILKLKWPNQSWTVEKVKRRKIADSNSNYYCHYQNKMVNNVSHLADIMTRLSEK